MVKLAREEEPPPRTADPVAVAVPEMWTVRDVMRLVRCGSARTINRLIANDGLPHIRLSPRSAPRFDPAAVLAWWEAKQRVILPPKSPTTDDVSVGAGSGQGQGQGGSSGSTGRWRHGPRGRQS